MGKYLRQQDKTEREDKIMKLVLIAGARPNFIKIAPLIWEIKQRQSKEKIDYFLIHTGQHFDSNMSGLFLTELEIEAPYLNLGVGSGSHAQQTAKIMVRLERPLKKIRPDLVVVVGDVNSTLAGALTAAKMGLKLAHIEAGLRSFDRRMPEEINRIVIDHLADYLFTSCREADENLSREGISPEKIYFVGNIIIDTLVRFKEKATALAFHEQFGLEVKKYGLMTLHRPSNVDEPHQLKEILLAAEEIAKHLPLLFPVHPRTRKMIDQFSQKDKRDSSSLILTPPLGYLEFLSLMINAKLVLTDSGGIQEETTFLQIPCLTLRENTERWITIKEGTNRLAGTKKEKIVAQALEIIKDQGKIKGSLPELWDGKTAGRIIDIIFQKLG